MASSAQNNHGDPVSLVIFWVTLIFFLGLIGRSIAIAFNQPGVLGELLMGVLVGNVGYFFDLHAAVILREGGAIFTVLKDMFEGVPLATAVHTSITDPSSIPRVMQALGNPNSIDLIKVAYVLDIFSRYGVIFLLFMVGLESSVEELKHTGRESTQVAFLGILGPIVLGFIIMYLLVPEASFNTHLFVAATLSATSVGITARVLKEMKKLRTREAKTILGAAVLDDILGLVILAVVSSIVVKNTIDIGTVAQIILLALLFLVSAILIGPWLIKKAVKVFSFLETWEVKLFISFIFSMGLAWLASIVQLATIIGAFAAGIIIHEGFFEREKTQRKELSVHDLMRPFEAILAPLFFMLIGIQVKLETFLHWKVLGTATGLIIAAILGKLISGLGAKKGDDRLLIGIGMLPRGEVGLVFASIGITLGVIDDHIFSSIIFMVIITTFIAPPWLKKRYEKREKVESSSS
ncbi:cation:proton antiporter [Legionella adelaidensis]|nr:cation:proton antiporter [Legionella adelaidensis]